MTFALFCGHPNCGIYVDALLRHQIVFGEGKFFHDFSADEVFLNDAFQNLGCATVIPRSSGINDGDRAVHADAETASLSAIDERFGADEIQFFEALLEKIPRRLASFARAALGFLGIHTEKNVVLNFSQAKFGGGGSELGIHFF